MKRKRGACPHCGEKMVEWKHTLSKSLILGLIALHSLGGKAKLSKLPIGFSAKNNFQKLQYWKFIEKSESGIWKLGFYGFKFLQGAISMPKSVWTFKGRVVEREGKHVSIKKLGYEPLGELKGREFTNPLQQELL